MATRAGLLGTQILGAWHQPLSDSVTVPTDTRVLLIWICGIESVPPDDYHVTVGGQAMTRLIGAVTSGDSLQPRQVSLYAVENPPVGTVALSADLGSPTFYGSIAAFLTGGLGVSAGSSAETGTSLQLGAAEGVGEGYIAAMVVRDTPNAHVSCTPAVVATVNDLSVSFTSAAGGLVTYGWDSGHNNYGTSVHITDTSVPRVFAPPDVAAGRATVTAAGVAPGVVHPAPQFAVCRATVTAAAYVQRPPHAEVDPIRGTAAVQVAAALSGTLAGVPDLVVGLSVVRVAVTPDLSDNEPITLAFTAAATMQLLPADSAGAGDSPWPSGEDQLEQALDRMLAEAAATGTAPAWTERRAMPGVSLTMPTPIVVAGKPVVPAWLVQLPSQAPAKIGATHIHATDPAPVWDPRTSGWAHPPPDGPDWDGRWCVDDLPDPPSGGYYWLGDPSAADGTAYYSGAKTRWAPHASTPHAPTWRSFFPYKPSVRAYDSYLPGGEVVHHPRGVHFNSQFVEHMWADFGGVRRQPFSWVIAAMLVGWPSRDYTQYLLDAGRNPDQAGVPRLSASGVYTDHTAHDNLPYRSLMAYSHQRQTLSSDGLNSARAVHSRAYPNVRPKMFFGVFNGAASRTGAWSTGNQRYGSGRISNAVSDHHRFYLLGRAQGVISQDRATHMLVFELRYWRSALSRDQLHEQYQQLSSTYQFDRYKAV